MPRVEQNVRQAHRHFRLTSRSLFFALKKQNRFFSIFSFDSPGFLALSRKTHLPPQSNNKNMRNFSFFERFSKALQDYPSLSRIVVVSTIRSSSIYAFICSCFYVTLRLILVCVYSPCSFDFVFFSLDRFQLSFEGTT